MIFDTSFIQWIHDNTYRVSLFDGQRMDIDATGAENTLQRIIEEAYKKGLEDGKE